MQSRSFHLGDKRRRVSFAKRVYPYLRAHRPSHLPARQFRPANAKKPDGQCLLIGLPKEGGKRYRAKSGRKQPCRASLLRADAHREERVAGNGHAGKRQDKHGNRSRLPRQLAATRAILPPRQEITRSTTITMPSAIAQYDSWEMSDAGFAMPFMKRSG